MPEPIGIAPLQNSPVPGVATAAANDEGSGYHLVFDATCSQPDFAKLFLSTGGSINTAAGAGPTDFSLTDSGTSVFANLHPHESKTISVGLPSSLFTKTEAGGLQMNVSSKLNLSSQRVGAAINGTLVDTHAGAGAVYLGNLLRARDTHTQVPCIYGALASHACTVGISNAEIVDADGNGVDIEFVLDPARQAALEKAEGYIEGWAKGAWATRQEVKYGLSPALTKSVAKAPVGANDKGYDLVHNVIDQEFAFGMTTLNSLLEHTVGMELEYNADDIAQMLKATESPGMKAAAWSQTIAAAASVSAAYLVSYRADGRTVMSATGSGFQAAESWLRRKVRTPVEANDCDGSGLMAMAMLNTARSATPEQLEKNPYVRAAKNAVFPYYTPGITVVGATAAEASGGGGSAEHVAGHALALMVPTLSLLESLDKGTSSIVGGKRVSTEAPLVRDARFHAVFSKEVLDTLPEDEAQRLRGVPRAVLSSWPQAAQLQPWAIEGTTPASPVLYDMDADRRYAATHNAERDVKAFDACAPNVGRSVKTLHVSKSRPGTQDVHRFYHDFVELSLHPSHPLYADATLREMGVATTQLVFARPGSHITEAGASPRQMVLGDYAMVPLHTVDTERGASIDFASVEAKRDVMPGRAGPMVLSVSQSRDLKRSIAALEQLDDSLTKEPTCGHTVAYTLAYSTLVNSPLAVEHFAMRLKEAAVAGVVDINYVEDLAVHADGSQAGAFIVANVCVKV